MWGGGGGGGAWGAPCRRVGGVAQARTTKRSAAENKVPHDAPQSDCRTRLYISGGAGGGKPPPPAGPCRWLGKGPGWGLGNGLPSTPSPSPSSVCVVCRHPSGPRPAMVTPPRRAVCPQASAAKAAAFVEANKKDLASEDELKVLATLTTSAKVQVPPVALAGRARGVGCVGGGGARGGGWTKHTRSRRTDLPLASAGSRMIRRELNLTGSDVGCGGLRLISGCDRTGYSWVAHGASAVCKAVLSKTVLAKALLTFFFFRTACKDRPQGPPTANRHQPSTANRQPPTANHCSTLLLWFCALPMSWPCVRFCWRDKPCSPPPPPPQDSPEWCGADPQRNSGPLSDAGGMSVHTLCLGPFTPPPLPLPGAQAIRTWDGPS